MTTEKKTFLGKVVAAILSIFVSNWKSFIVKLWTKIPEELKQELLEVVGIIDLIKNYKHYTDSPLIDIIVNITPTNLDNEALAWLRKTLSEIIGKYNLEHVKSSELQAGHLQTIATELTVASTGMSYGQAAISIENAYQNAV